MYSNVTASAPAGLQQVSLPAKVVAPVGLQQGTLSSNTTAPVRSQEHLPLNATAPMGPQQVPLPLNTSAPVGLQQVPPPSNAVAPVGPQQEIMIDLTTDTKSAGEQLIGARPTTPTTNKRSTTQNRLTTPTTTGKRFPTARPATPTTDEVKNRQIDRVDNIQYSNTVQIDPTQKSFLCKGQAAIADQIC